MRTARQFSQKVNGWRLIVAALSPELVTKPHLQTLYDELVSVLEEAGDLLANQEGARSQLQDSTQLRQALELRGDRIRSRLASFLRGELGPQSAQLIRFGVPPLPRSHRRQSEPPPAPPTQPEAPAPSASSGDSNPTE